ncbi:type I-G CRISPR-associated protein Cas8g1/Csx17 [Prescottella subtropica]|uniref:type I-G CRISPR-associated protein Cas8g1/Csx17 n=1 Tax=Prescottella subtropica TaxID=2545757 RepID=UPI0010F75941|nr:type I-U CRISPR-associated protein Csx17 [Prescottella subtropica]
MTVHEIAGIRNRSLMRSLAGLGLIRVLSEQADPGLVSRFVGEDLQIRTAVDDLAVWLVDEYWPRPVLSPWNEGSGYGAKDKTPKSTLEQLLAIEGTRLARLREAHRIVAPIAQRARDEKWGKDQLVLEIRNVCPDEMLPWINAAVVLLGDDDLAFPPLLGSGGNDGRLDFSTNYHQRLLEVLPTSERLRESSLAAARDFLEGTALSKLSRGTSGQFDPGATGTPNSSTYGAADGLVNPWSFVLMIEGATWFAASPARRLGMQSHTAPRAAMTFTTYGSANGTPTGSDAEESRGEVWVPSWVNWLSLSAVQRIFTEGRAVWNGRIAVQSADMYLAAGSNGVSAAISSFDRYSLLKRNGLSYSAVRTDTVDVHSDSTLALVAEVETWPNRASSTSRMPRTVQEAAREFGQARITLAKAEDDAARALSLRRMLAGITRIEAAVARGTHSRAALIPRAPTPANHLIDLLGGPLRFLLEEAEFRIALGVASLTWKGQDGNRSGHGLREFLLPVTTVSGRTTWTEHPVVEGFTLRPLVDVLSDVLVRHVLDGAASSTNPPTTGVRGPESGIPVPIGDIHAFSRGALDDHLIQEWIEALLVFDWRGIRSGRQFAVGGLALVPDPRLALLGLLRDGFGAPESNDGAAGRRYALTTEIVVPLAHDVVAPAVRTARQRLRQCGFGTITSDDETSQISADGRRLAAALLPRSHHRSTLDLIGYPLKPLTTDTTAREDS